MRYAGTSEWENEPNMVQLNLNGFDCQILRMPMGHLCGYLRVPNGHPWHGVYYSDIDAEVHGGLTFGGALANSSGYWIGFDCAQYNDFIPSIPNHVRAHETTYRNVAFVTAELNHLSFQAARAGK